ncbi:MAG: multidrug effflux MFS transporter [Pseudomonadota bacterium]
MAEPPAAGVRFLDKLTAPTLFTMIMVSALGPISMNMFLPSMPSMAEHFDVEYSMMTLAVTAYLAAMGVMQMFFGPLSDRYGRRPVLLTAFSVFIVATVGCLIAPTFEVFIACRLLQAGAAAGLVLARAMARDLYGPDEAASRIGWITMGMAVGPMLSPMVGGLLEQHYGWQAAFAAMLGFGALALVLAWGDAGETNRHRSSSIAAQMRGYPELIRSRRFWGYAAAAAFASGSFFAFLGGASYVGTRVLGLSPDMVGFYFGFIACGYMSGNFCSGMFSARVGMNRMILVGTLVATTGMTVALALHVYGIVHPVALFGPILLVGLGNGMTIPNATAGTLTVRPHLAGSASGLGSTLMIGGGAGFAALTGMMLTEDAGALPLIGPYLPSEPSALPLIAMMLASSVASVLAMLYVFWVASRRGPLPQAMQG